MYIMNNSMKGIASSSDLGYLAKEDENLIMLFNSRNGEPFYCIRDNFCFPCANVEKRGVELTYFEWEGNEKYICGENAIKELTKKALSFLNALKKEMHSKYAGVLFDIVISIDQGDEDISPSATVRFYAVRDNIHVIKKEEIDCFSQPILICQVKDDLQFN